MYNLFENIISKGNIPGTSSLFNSVSSNPQITGNTGGGITPQSLSQAKSSIDVSNQIKQKYGFDDKDIQFLRLAKEKGYDSQKAMEYLQNKKKPENQNIYKGKMSNPIFNVVGGAVAEVPNVIGQTTSFLSKAGQYTPTGLLTTGIKAGFSDKTFGQLMDEQTAEANKIAELGGKGKAFVQKYGAYDPTSFGAKSGEFITDISASLVGPNKVGLLKKGGQMIGAGKKLTTGAKIGDIALEGGLAGAKYDVATKGEITPESVGIGALANVGFAGVIKGVGKAYEGVTKRLPASLTLGGLINPGKLDVVKKSLQVDEGVATPEDVGKWILDRVKPGNKQEIAEQLIQHAEKTKGAVDESLASIPTYFKNPEAKKALMQIRNELEGKVGLEGRLAQIDEMLAKPDYTLSELNAVKRELDNMYNLYTKTADPTAGIKAEGLRNVRANIRKFIEDEAEKYGVNVRKLNNETATARGLADGILRKDSSESVRELLTAFAPSGAGAVVGAGQAIARGEDPLTILRDAVIGGVATKVATSTAIRTRIASALNRLAPKDLTALENYIRSGGKDAIGKKVAENVIKEGRALPARTLTKPEDFAKPPEKAIITPQTQEKAIIQESKKGLSPNVKRPNSNTNNTPSNSRVLPVGSKEVQETSSEVTPKVVKPSPTLQKSIPKKKEVTPIVKKPVETNITRNEAIEKGYSDSAKARWDKGEFTMKERGEATKYLKSNYKGKEYTIDGKKYKVDAIDNRNEQVRLIDSEGNIIRVKTNKLPEVKVTDKDIFEYYNGRVQKGYKTILKPSPKPIVKKPLEKTIKDAVGNWKPVDGKYTLSNIDISKTNAFPRAKYHREDYINTPSYKYWLEQAKNGADIPPVVVEKTPTGFNVMDGYHRLAAAEDAGIKNIKAVILDTPVLKGEKAKGVKQFTAFSDAEIQKMSISKPLVKNLQKTGDMETKKLIDPVKAIKKYTNNSDKINKMLREGKEDSTVLAVDDFINKQPSYKGDVYRGLTVDEGKYDSILENIRKNGIKDKAYTSTTENYGDATTFARNGNGKKGIILEIQSTNGRKIDAKYNPYNEEEILFPRNTQFEYVGEYKDAGRGLVIKLKESPKKLSIGDMETKKLIEEAKTLGKYDNSYDVVNGKKLYRGGNEDGVFWTDDIDIAKSFGDEGAIEKTITIKKPLDVRSKGIRDYIKKNTDIKIDDATSAYSRSLPEFKKLMKWAKDNGYDGIIGKTSDNGLNFTGNEFVVIK